MAYNACDGRPAELARAVLCLVELSKDVEGDLLMVASKVHECPELDCRTLTVEHLLRGKFPHICATPGWVSGSTAKSPAGT